MAYHRGGHAGAVAVSYSSSAMPTSLSPNRRYSSGSSGTTTSGVGSSSTKLSSYRSSASSSFDRSSYYSSGSNLSSGYGSHRSSYSSSDYRRFCSPARSLSVSSASSFSDAGCSSGNSSSSGIGGSSGSGLGSSSTTSSAGRYSTSSSRDRSESRDIVGSSVTSAADIIAKYSPATYVPNIIASNERHAAAAAAAAAAASSSSSSSTLSYNGYGSSPSSGNSTAIFGGNAANANKLSTTNELSTSDIIQGRPPRATRRSPINTLQINNHATLQPASGVATEVTRLQLLHLKGDNNDNNNNSNNKNNNNSANDNVTNEEKTFFYDHGINDNENDASSGRINSNLNDCTSESNGGIFTCRSEVNNSTLFRNNTSVTPSNNSDSVVCIDNTVDGFTKISNSNNSNLLFTNTELSNNNLNSNNEEDATVDNVYTDDIDVGDLTKDKTNADDQVSGDTIHFRDNYLNNQDPFNGDIDIVTENNSTILNNHGDVTPLLLLPSTSNSFFNSLDLTSGGVRSTLRNKGVVSRPSGNQTRDNTNTTLPSTSRRGDTYTGNGSTSNGSSNGLGNTSQSATAHQNIYRGIADQIEGSPTIRAPRNRLQTPRDERCGLNGLRNIGNTCFMNSVIQCLSNTRPLLEYLVNEQYLADINTTTSGMKGALIKAFSQVIQELWEVGGDHVVNTASLKSQIQRFAPRFMGYSQQDAQEFLRYLLEGLHEDVNRVTVKPQPIHTDIPDHYSDSQKAAESWKRYLRNEDSTIVDVFVGQLRSSLHCTSCGHVSVTLDPFWDLSLPIPTRSGTVKLNQCLEHFTREEILDGDEKPTCSKCQMRRKCTKRFSIQKFPKILVIHLKRFSPMERFRGKLNTLVDFPLTGLDLGAFSAPRVAGCTYNLYGVANHSGTTYSGHYTAYCKHPYSGEWHEYNDSRVSMIAARSVVSSEGYVLFYEQQPHSSNL